MAEVTPPSFVEVSNYYNAWDYGAPYKDLITEGVVGATDLAVTQRGAGANNSVDVAAGTCWVFGDDNPTQQPNYRCYNNATKNVVLAQDATNPRIALIVAHAYDAHFSGATFTWAIEAILGTPAGSPVAPALPNNCLLLATVTVPAVGGNVTNAQITDNRGRISSGMTIGATDGQVPVWNAANGRWQPGTLSTVLTRDTTIVDLVSSVTETDLFGGAGTGLSIPGGTLGTNKQIRIWVGGEALNNTAANTNGANMTLYYGATSILSTVLQNTIGANRFPWLLFYTLTALGATNAQMAVGAALSQSAVGVAYLPQNGAAGRGIMAEDSTVAKNLRLTATLSANSASLEFKKRFAIVEVV